MSKFKFKKWMIGGIIGIVFEFLCLLMVLLLASSDSTRELGRKIGSTIWFLGTTADASEIPGFSITIYSIFYALIGAIIGLLFDNFKKIKRMFK